MLCWQRGTTFGSELFRAARGNADATLVVAGTGLLCGGSVRTLRLIATEMVIAACVAGALSVSWILLGSLGTWIVAGIDRPFKVLDAHAAALVAVPTFVVAWILFTMRRFALQRRGRFVAVVCSASFIGAAFHRAAFLDVGFWALPDGSVLGLVEATFDAFLRRVATAEFSWIGPSADTHAFWGVDSTWLMDASSVAVATALAGISYDLVRKILPRSTPGER